MGVKERKAMEKQLRRNQILDAARELLFSSGIDSISISNISARAELGVGTIYFYYKNKEEIFIALQQEGVALLYASIFKISQKKISPEKKITEVADSYYRFSEEQKQYYDIINYFLSSPTIFFEPKLKSRIDMSGHKILLVIQDIVKEGVHQNIFKEDDPRRFSVLFWGSLHGLMQFKKLERTVLEKENHRQLYDYSVRKLIHSMK